MEEQELNLLTFEDFKNEISSKNDKIKSQSDMWWIQLKSDLLYYANQAIEDPEADIINILIVYLSTNLANIAMERHPTDKSLKKLNNNTIRLRNVSKKDIADFLTILLKYVKSTSRFNQIIDTRYIDLFRRDNNWGSRWPTDIGSIIQHIESNDIKDVYYNLFLESVKLIEYAVSQSYSRRWGPLEEYVDCYSLFHSIQKYYEVDEDGDQKYQLFRDIEEHYMTLTEEKGELEELIKESRADILSMDDCVMKTEQELSKNPSAEIDKHLQEKISGCKKASQEFSEHLKVYEQKLDDVLKKMRDYNFPVEKITKEIVEKKYDLVKDIISRLGRNDRNYHRNTYYGKSVILSRIDKDKLIEDLKKISVLFEEIIMNKIFAEIEDKDLSKIVDQCMIKEIELYTLIFSIFIDDYKSLKEYYEDVDGRKSKGLANLDDYDFKDVVVCIENYINRAKYELLYTSNPTVHTTKLKFLYDEKERHLLQDSDEELEDIRRIEKDVSKSIKKLKEGVFEFPDGYLKKGDYVVFRETRKDEMPWYTGNWNHLVPSGNNLMKYSERIPPRTIYEMDDDEKSDEMRSRRLANYTSSDDYEGGSSGGMEGNQDQYYYNTDGERNIVNEPDNTIRRNIVNEPDNIIRSDNIIDELNFEPEPQDDSSNYDDYYSDDPISDDYDSDDPISDEEDFQSFNYIENSWADDSVRDKAYYGIGKLMSIGDIQSIDKRENGKYCIIKWKRGYYNKDTINGGLDKSEKNYQNLFIFKPISAVQKTEDLLDHKNKTLKVKYTNWLNDKILIDRMRGSPVNHDIYGFKDLFPWPTGERGDDYKLQYSHNIHDEELKKLNPWNIYDEKEGPVILGKAIKELSKETGVSTDRYELFRNKSNENYLTESPGYLSEFLDSVFDYFIDNGLSIKKFPETEEMTVTVLEYNLSHTIDNNPYEAIVELFQSADPYDLNLRSNLSALPELKGVQEELDESKKYSDNPKKYSDKSRNYIKSDTPVLLHNYTGGGTGKLIEIRMPDEWPFNNISHAIAFIEVEVYDYYGKKSGKKIIIQRLLRNLNVNYADPEKLKLKEEERSKLQKIEDEYEDRNIQGEPTQYIDNPYRKNKDIYNRKLKELGMGDIFERMIVQQKTNFKDKEIKMLELASEKAKKSSEYLGENQDVSLAPEYLKWMQYIKEIEPYNFPYTEGDLKENYLPKGVSTRLVDFGPEELDDRRKKDSFEQPDVVELEYLDSLGIDKQSVMLDPKLLQTKSLKQYDMNLGPQFRGSRDLRRDILSNRVPSDESSESRNRRVTRMNRLVDRIDRERELNRINRENISLAQMRADAYISSDEEDDPQGLANMFNTDRI